MCEGGRDGRGGAAGGRACEPQTPSGTINRPGHSQGLCPAVPAPAASSSTARAASPRPARRRPGGRGQGGALPARPALHGARTAAHATSRVGEVRSGSDMGEHLDVRNHPQPPRGTPMQHAPPTLREHFASPAFALRSVLRPCRGSPLLRSDAVQVERRGGAGRTLGPWPAGRGWAGCAAGHCRGFMASIASIERVRQRAGRARPETAAVHLRRQFAITPSG